MKQITTESVEVFWEDKVPVGMLLLNGSAQFYRVTKAQKDFVRQSLLQVQAPAVRSVEPPPDEPDSVIRK